MKKTRDEIEQIAEVLVVIQKSEVEVDATPFDTRR
jgi:hypothetical protein